MNEKKISLDETFKIAVDLHSKGNLVEAKNIFEKILRAKPDQFLSLANLGIVFAQLKEFNEAIKLLDKTLKIDPNYIEGHNNLGNIFFELSEFDKSIDCYKRAIKLCIRKN